MRRNTRGRTFMLLAVMMSLATVLVIAAPATAHKHARPAVAESLGAAPRDTAPGAVADGVVPAGAEAVRQAPFALPPLREALREHPHNKAVHFPLALALAAALLMVLARRRPALEPAGRWLVWLAALGGAAAFVTGRLQEEAFEGEPKQWLVDLHERWGTATAITLLVWALVTLWKPARRHAWLVGLVASALVLITGFYGGVVAHGE